MPAIARNRLLFVAAILGVTGTLLRAETPVAEPPAPNLPKPEEVADRDWITFGMPPMSPNPGPGMPFEMDASSSHGGDQKGGNEWVVAPVPFISPLVGVGLAVGAGYIYHPPGQDPKLTPWVTGAGGFYSDNHSWAIALGHKMNLKNDTWRLFGLGGYGVLNYDFYGIGPFTDDRRVSLHQKVEGLNVEGLYRVRANLYAGLNYSFAKVSTGFGGSSSLPPEINAILMGRQADAVVSMPSLRLQWDTRDNTFYPTSGWLVDGEAVFSNESFGSDFNYQAISVTARHYWRLSETQTVGAYAWGRFAYGDVPFFALSMIGAKGNLRGYPVGRYQDLMAVTGQIEYRWQAWSRVGFVAFGGVGAVAPDLEGFMESRALPSVGVGVRYMLSKKNHLNFRLDLSWGRDEQLVYLGVGEAF